MVHNNIVCHVIARYDQLWPHLTQLRQFWSIFEKCPWIATYVLWRQLVANMLNMASNGPGWLFVGNGGQLWSWMSSFNKLVHFKAELKNLALVYMVMAYTSLWDKISQIWSRVANNDPIFVTMSRYDRLKPYLSPYYLFWAILVLSVRFDQNAVKVPGKRKCSQKCSIMMQCALLQPDITNYGDIWHSTANSDQFPKSAPEVATYVLWRQLVADTA